MRDKFGFRILRIVPIRPVLLMSDRQKEGGQAIANPNVVYRDVVTYYIDKASRNGINLFF